MRKSAVTDRTVFIAWARPALIAGIPRNHEASSTTGWRLRRRLAVGLRCASAPRTRRLSPASRALTLAQAQLAGAPPEAREAGKGVGSAARLLGLRSPMRRGGQCRLAALGQEAAY